MDISVGTEITINNQTINVYQYTMMRMEEPPYRAYMKTWRIWEETDDFVTRQVLEPFGTWHEANQALANLKTERPHARFYIT